MKPVYVINGFLSSGKTSFFAYTIGQPYFRIKGTTLLITCEDGEVGYGPKLLAATNTVRETIESVEDFTPAKLMSLDAKHNPTRILIEWNGMWDFRQFKLPRRWQLEQQMTTIDASTFPMYFNNMKSLLAEQIRKTELVMINRCDGIDKKTLISYKRNIKAINPEAELIFEDANGEVDTAEAEDLPYDINQDPIQLKGLDYAIWFQDVIEHPDWYVGKSVQFDADILRPAGFPEGYFAAGRPIMGCCAYDIRIFGELCKTPEAAKLNDGDWAKITAEIKPQTAGECAGYNMESMHQGGYDAVIGEGMMLHVKQLEKIDKPADPVLDFTNPA